MNEGGAEKKGLDRRGFFTALGAGVAAGAGGAIEHALDTDWSNLKSPEEKIQFLRTSKSGFDKDEQFRKMSVTPVIGREQYGRAEYIHHAFSVFEANKMPKNIQDLLATLAPGIPAQESRYDNEKTSGAGAQYIWQITPIAIKEINRIRRTEGGDEIILDQTKNLQVGTQIAFQYFDRTIYSAMAESAKKCAEHFGLVGENENEKFITLCMINAYNAGPTRMRNVLNKFASAYNANDIRSAYDYTATTLFNALSERAMRDNLDAGYKTEASQYTFAVLAGAESLHAQYKMNHETTLTDSLIRKGLQAKDFAIEEIAEPATAGVAAAGAVYATNQFSGEKKTDAFTRRTLLTAVAAAGAIGALGSQIPHNKIDMSSLNLWWNKEASQRAAAEKSMVFADGTKYQPESVARALSQWYKENQNKRLLANLKPAETQKVFQEQLNRLEKYRGNFTREGVPALMQRLQTEKKIHQFRDKEEINGTLGKKFLVPVDEINALWRTRGIGSGAISTPKNDKQFLRLTNGTEAALRTIAERFQLKLTQAGIAQEWSVRFVVNSLLRTKNDTNQALGGAASNESPHTFGMGFDISNKHFDLIHNQDKTFLMLGSEDIQDSTETLKYTAIVNTLNQLIASVLEEMHAGGEITLTYEPKRVHYHITSKRN
ncbi:MAG: DUF5715 family protein [Patescibacteria group bacterium]